MIEPYDFHLNFEALKKITKTKDRFFFETMLK